LRSWSAASSIRGSLRAGWRHLKAARQNLWGDLKRAQDDLRKATVEGGLVEPVALKAESGSRVRTVSREKR